MVSVEFLPQAVNKSLFLEMAPHGRSAIPGLSLLQLLKTKNFVRTVGSSVDCELVAFLGR